MPYVFVTNKPRIQILTGDGDLVLDFIEDLTLAQKMAWKMNISHWTMKEPKA